jgi:hypothetical protein
MSFLLFRTIVVLILLQISTSTQLQAIQLDSPTKVIERFCSLDERGARLTREGWNEAAALFLKPIPFPKDWVIEISKSNILIGKPQVAGNAAEVWMQYTGLGQIDSKLHFSWGKQPPGPVFTRGLYTLVLTDRHWILYGEHDELKEVAGAKEWRIKDFQLDLLMKLDTAISYITEMRDKSKDPIIKKNANRTIAILIGYAPKPKH